MGVHDGAVVKVSIRYGVVAIPRRGRKPQDYDREYEFVHEIPRVDARPVARLPSWKGPQVEDAVVELLKGSDGSFLVECAGGFDRWSLGFDDDDPPLTVDRLQERIWLPSHLGRNMPSDVVRDTVPDDANVLYDGAADLEDRIADVRSALDAHRIVDGKLAVVVREPVIRTDVRRRGGGDIPRRMTALVDAPDPDEYAGLAEATRHVGLRDWHEDLVPMVRGLPSNRLEGVHWSFKDLMAEVSIIDPMAFDYDRLSTMAPHVARDVLERTESLMVPVGDVELFEACVGLARLHPQAVPDEPTGHAPDTVATTDLARTAGAVRKVVDVLRRHDGLPYVASALERFGWNGVEDWIAATREARATAAPEIMDVLVAAP